MSGRVNTKKDNQLIENLNFHVGSTADRHHHVCRGTAGLQPHHQGWNEQIDFYQYLGKEISTQ